MRDKNIYREKDNQGKYKFIIEKMWYWEREK
jgi:hypothetical protein